jgi:hypothetical protein
MTHSRNTTDKLSKEEIDEMVVLKNAMNYDISQVNYNKMEEFSAYFVQSLKDLTDS